MTAPAAAGQRGPSRRAGHAGQSLGRLWLQKKIACVEEQLKRLDRALAHRPTKGREERRQLLESYFDDLWAWKEANERPRGICGKVIYPSEKIAQMARDRLIDEGRDRAEHVRFRPYPCELMCGGWHIGHRFIRRTP